jgi:predicted DNA-binding transcriptional regulator AlpA
MPEDMFGERQPRFFEHREVVKLSPISRSRVYRPAFVAGNVIY